MFYWFEEFLEVVTRCECLNNTQTMQIQSTHQEMNHLQHYVPITQKGSNNPS